jgi:hypothetical protein
MEEEVKFIKNLYLWIIAIVVVLSIGGYMWKRASEAAHLQDAVIVYEEYQEIYNTCSKLNTDLCNMKSLDEKDVMFEQFSKAQRVNTIKTQLNKWVEDYNAKSKMWGRSLWKSSSLPYELNVNEFNCYNN